MTKGNGVTHFTELHRTLHKNFLIWRWPIADTLSQVKAEEEKSQRKESRNYEQRR